MAKLKYSFWFWFSVTVTTYTVYDYIKHLRYPDSIFLEHAFSWFLFSFLSLAILLGVIYGCQKWLNRYPALRKWYVDGLPIFAAALVHIFVTGPLLSSIFWPYTSLQFQFKLVPLLILLGFFYSVRLGFYLLFRRISPEQKS